MNTKSLFAFLAVLQLTGCVLVADGSGGHQNDPYAVSGDVTFTWSFAGRTCAENPDIQSVIIHIPGERLQNEGVFPCTANNYPGIVLHDFAPGRYDYTVEAVDYGNRVLFDGAGSFTVNGNVRATVDLTPVGGPNSYAYLSWRFPANEASSNPSCAQAGVAFVDVTLDGDTARFDCEDGFSMPGVQTAYLSPGTHDIRFTALSESGYPYYSFRGTLSTFSGDPVYAEYSLNWAVGGAAVRWQMVAGSVGYSCGQAGVQRMTINFQDEQGNFVYGSTGDVQACDAAPVVYNFLLPGTYRVFIEATGSSTWLSSSASPPVVVVRAGEFLGPDDAATVLLRRAQ